MIPTGIEWFGLHCESYVATGQRNGICKSQIDLCSVYAYFMLSNVLCPLIGAFLSYFSYILLKSYKVITWNFNSFKLG